MKNGPGKDLLYQIALTRVPNIGTVQARTLLEHFADAASIFNAKKSALERIPGIGSIRAESIRNYTDFLYAEKEIRFLQTYNIEPLFIKDINYPKRLLNCYDPPTLLYYKGKAELNNPKTVAVIGTRNNTENGRALTEDLIKGLKDLGVLVISGLAFGIDGIAHKAAIKNRLPTVGVLAHGLDLLYPPQHRTLAKDILNEGGGLLTEFPSETPPDKHQFPNRNRVVAGMCDCVVVIESGCKGGSMVTAELANGYNRDVFAYPGRVSDSKSSGCLQLIQNNKASLLKGAEDLLNFMGWTDSKPKKAPSQREIFVQLNEQEKILVDILKETEAIHIDEVYQKSGLSAGTVASITLALEMRGVIQSLPGKLLRLC